MFASATNSSGFHVIDEMAQVFSRIGAAFAGAQEANRVYNRLSGLSAEQLAARGLSREDIGRMTLQALTSVADR